MAVDGGMKDTEIVGDTVEENACGPRPREHSCLPHLFLVLECARPLAGGVRHDLGKIDEVWIGRDSKRSASRSIVDGVRVLAIRVPDKRMSERHARIKRAGDHFTFEDLGSTNGSRIGRASTVGPTLLLDGDFLETGRTFFRFRSALPTRDGSLADLDACLQQVLSPGFSTLLPALSAKQEALAKVARSRVPMLLLGETGTGKEVAARAIHSLSGRPGAFVGVNCGAIPPALVESHLFGHIRGAFSGATRDEPGFVRAAHMGTLLLDEIGDLPMPAQTSLLRVLQEREVVPVGSAKAVQVDLRVLGATHHDLANGVARGLFRADLFARLAGFTHRLPSLRERREDIGLILAALLAPLASGRESHIELTPEAGRRLLAHEWPFNIRELQQTLSVAVVLAGDAPIDIEHLAEGMRRDAAVADGIDFESEALRTRLLEELERAGGNVSAVARSMSKARMQVQRWMKRFNIDPNVFRVSCDESRSRDALGK